MSAQSSGPARSTGTASPEMSADKRNVPAGPPRANDSRTIGMPSERAASAAGGSGLSPTTSAAARIFASRYRQRSSSYVGLSGAQVDQLIVDTIAAASSGPLGSASATREPRPNPIAASAAPARSTWRSSAP